MSRYIDADALKVDFYDEYETEDDEKCKWSNRLYDYTGKWTGSIWCAKRNGKIRKRFRGECKYIEREGE